METLVDLLLMYVLPKKILPLPKDHYNNYV